MTTYSELCARAAQLFSEAKQIRSKEDYLGFWNHALQIGTELTLGTFVQKPRFNKRDFDKATWPLVTKLFKPFLGVGCVEPHYEGKSLVAYVLVPPKFKPDVLEQLTKRLAGAGCKKTNVLPMPASTKRIPPEIRLVHTKPLRKKVEPSVAVIVDLANITNYEDEHGRRVLAPERMNWAALLKHLAMWDGKSLPVDRAVLCVSKSYYSEHYAALQTAERHGFTVTKMFGDKEADPVVMSEIVKVVLDHLNVRYADRIPTLVLASGDKDFVPMVDTLRPIVAHEGLKLQLRIATWRHSCSPELYRASTEALFIDDILSSIDSIGAKTRVMRTVLRVA